MFGLNSKSQTPGEPSIIRIISSSFIHAFETACIYLKNTQRDCRDMELYCLLKKYPIFILNCTDRPFLCLLNCNNEE